MIICPIGNIYFKMAQNLVKNHPKTIILTKIDAKSRLWSPRGLVGDKIKPQDLLLGEPFGELPGGIANFVPRGFHRDPDVALGLQARIDVQRTRADQHHARPLLGAREQVAPARLAERTELAGRGVEGHEVVRAGHDLEAAFLHGQDRRKRGAGKLPAIRTMAVREDQDLSRALVPHFPAIATARLHGDLLGFRESVPQTARNAKGEGTNHGWTRIK